MTTSEFIKELQELVKQRPDLSDKEIVAVDSDGLVTGFDVQFGYVNGECHVGELDDLIDESPEDYEECICLLINM